MLKRRKRLSDARRMRRMTPSAFYGVHSNRENAYGLSGSLVLLPGAPIFTPKRGKRLALPLPLRGPQPIRLSQRPWLWTDAERAANRARCKTVRRKRPCRCRP